MFPINSRKSSEMVLENDKTYRITAFPFVRKFLLFLFIFAFWSVIHSGTAFANSLDKRITLTTTLSHQVVAGAPIPLKIQVHPAPTRQKPVHLHVYIDQKMAQMVTLTRRITHLKLPSLTPGKHTIIFIEANPLTHQPMEGASRMTGMKDKDMDMEMKDSGKGMGMMDDNLSSIPARFRLKTLTLVVEPR
uniref:Uncharacterized protein n=1 Tax=Leptospirillum ferriphilum TaxID=178606 RepID=A0A7C3R083_9BACT